MHRLARVTLALIAGCHPHAGPVAERKPDDAPPVLTVAPPPAQTAPPPPVAPPPEPLVSLARFEGEISMAMVINGKAGPSFRLLARDGLVRFDVPTDAPFPRRPRMVLGHATAFLLFSPSSRKLFVVNDEERHVRTIDQDEALAMLFSMSPYGWYEIPAPTVTRTGKEDSVAGVPCVEWKVENKDRSGLRTCLSMGDEPSFPEFSDGKHLLPQHLWTLQLLYGAHFPLRNVAYDALGREASRVEVVALSRRPLDPSLFEVPVGYELTDWRFRTPDEHEAARDAREVLARWLEAL